MFKDFPFHNQFFKTILAYEVLLVLFNIKKYPTRLSESIFYFVF